MGNVCLAIVFTFTSLGALAAQMKVVYGTDNRLDIAKVTNRLHARLAASTAAMIQTSKISTTGAKCTIGFDETLETGLNVCASEKFSQQPIGAMCSGFLVGPDTIVTAGHCLKSLGPAGFPTPASVCKNFSWVFNYAVDKTGRDPLVGAASDVYRCKTVVNATLTDTQDFAVIKLDRAVTGRAPLQFRTIGKIADRTSLVVIGHPSGLPSKVSAGARVLTNTDRATFGANLDTFQGNSGSGVFNALTGQLEGILVQGKTDYRPNLAANPRSCQVVNVCNDTGVSCQFAPRGDTMNEVVTRITLVAPAIAQAKNFKVARRR